MKTLALAFAVAVTSPAFATNTTPAEQQTAGNQQQQNANQSDEESERLICRRVGERLTGSKLRSKVCLTAEQWEARRR